jgi:hypothetical protein
MTRLVKIGGQKILKKFCEFCKMLQRKFSSIGEFFHWLNLTHVFQIHPVCLLSSFEYSKFIFVMTNDELARTFFLLD